VNSTGQNIQGGSEHAPEIQDVDVSEVDQPSTPTRTARVVIYTPSKTWVPVDEDYNLQSYDLKKDRAPAEVPADEEGSIFSMNQYGSMDWDHSGNEFDKIQVPKKHTRGTSTPPPDDVYESIELGSPQPTTRKRRASKATSRGSDGRPFTPVRDEKGRFSSAIKIEPGYESDPEYHPRIERQRAYSISSVKSNIVRDSKGRFASRSKSESVHKAEFEPKRARRRTYSVSSMKSSNLARDSQGRFALKQSPKVSSEAPTPTTPGKRSSTGVSEMKLPILTRDKKGHFSKQKYHNEEQGTQEPVEYAPSPTPLESDSPENELSQPQRPQLMGQDDEGRSTTSDDKKAKAKAKRPPAKSPYFMTPPVTPSKSSKSKAPKSKVGDDSKADIPKAPKKEDDDDISSSQNSPRKRSPGGLVSCIPFPPLASPTFGLIQEKLANDPFRLLIAVTFLIRTHGKHAIPVFYSLMEQYPTPESLVAADTEDIISIIRHLGLQNQRAATYQMYAKIWLEDPPTKGRRYAVRGYPTKDSGRDIKKCEILTDTDASSAWEIGHMTQGPYAIDSWRIFCRDVLRGVATGWNGEGSTEEGFQPEWMRVVPEDKELRAYLRWMWLKEGFEWDPFTGEKEVANEGLMRAAIEGRVAWDDMGGMRILEEEVDDLQLSDDVNDGGSGM
jgi:methyl-CpG-binding domain protein 4